MVAFLLIASAACGWAEPAETIRFNRDIRPILAEHCFQCHGPDAAQRLAELRLDQEAGVSAKREGRSAVVKGDPAQSELFRRITAIDPDKRMPPADSGRPLSPRQIELLRRWIEQGAKWEPHWSLMPPTRPELPEVKNNDWVRNPIDAFVLARLEAEKLAPSPAADKSTLIRRVSLDLTGLPPTPGEVAEFLADNTSEAYERLVHRLLDSPRYGERMASDWLDAARYADTNGYQSDGERFMWRWRDWVIEAYNRNMPFDQFTIEQLAGDLLPSPTLDQRIATGFNRNHRGNAEGGIVPEEYAVEYVVDRVDTTATVWMGLTLGCTRCHDHKFDPFTQRDFYRLFAFFNNVPERGKAIKYGNSPPMIKAPTQQQQQQLKELQSQLDSTKVDFAKKHAELLAAQTAWEEQLQATPPPNRPTSLARWTLSSGLLARYEFEDTDWRLPANLPVPQMLEGKLAQAPGISEQAAQFDGRRFVEAGDVGDFGFYDKFTLSAWVYPRGNAGGTIVSRMTDSARSDGYALVLAEGRLQFNLVKRWLDDALRVESETSLQPDRWHHVAAVYDGSRVASGIQLYLNGEVVHLKVHLDDLNQSFQTSEPLRIGAGGGPENRFRGLLDDVRIYNRPLDASDVALLSTPESPAQLCELPRDRRTPRQTAKLRAYFLEQHAPPEIRNFYQRLQDLQRAHAQLVESFPTTMVMEEMHPPRETYMLVRGEYDKRGERVTAGVPAVLPPLPDGVPANRLGLAKWLVDPGHPLTARVAVNRYWQQYFGAGLVKTMEDFGTQGEWPSHLELLDWLASEFVASGWDVKRLQQTIVTSAAYRQSSRVTAELLKRDPENRLLARGPRLRLSAEMIRDQALAISGLLVEKIGGPSVKPYQPAGLWKELAGGVDYTPDSGESLYRRSLYTFWKRTIAPPAMVAFDAAGRETCVVRQSRTNTPLQALTLLNDVTYVEASRALAQRMLREGGDTPASRVAFAFQLATARQPKPPELQVLLEGLSAHQEAYRQNPRAAEKLLAIGQSPRDPQLDPAELAACTAVAGLILNLDETVTKQ